MRRCLILIAAAALCLTAVPRSHAATANPIRAATDSLLVAVAPAETLSVHVDGAGANVVLVPGMLGASYGFRRIVPPLVERGTRVTIVNMLGTGASGRPENADYSFTAHAHRLAAALDSLQIARATLVCHSVGASVCYRLAIDRPDLVGSIVSINGGPTEQAGTDGLRLALRFAPLIKLFGGEGMARGKVRSGLRDSAADPSWVTEEVVDAYVASYGKDLDAVLRTLKRFAFAEESQPLAPRLDQVSAPVLLLVGGSPNRAIRDEEITLLQQELPSIEVEVVPDAGQYIHEEQPAAVVDAIMRMAGQRAW